MALKLTNLPIAWGDSEFSYVAVVQQRDCQECKKRQTTSLSFGIDHEPPVITICKECVLKYFKEFEDKNR